MKQSKTTFLNIPVAESSDTEGSSVWPLEGLAIRKLLEALGAPPIRVKLWDGQEYYRSPHGEPVAGLVIRNRQALWRLFTNPNLNFGDGYSLGHIEVEGDFVALLEAIFRAKVENTRPGTLQSFLSRGLVRQRKNSLTGSQQNISHHYDLGNDFYRLWLDEEMAYTCAYFPTPEATLEEAQFAKHDHVARKLQLKPGDTVVEAGCGWGGLSRHMARHYGVKVKAFNISKEQVAYARERAEAEGLDDRIEYVQDDYRTIQGRYDVFVSVGMLEHVGVANYAGLGELIDRVLKKDGRGLIHTIGQNRAEPTGAWIEKRIFPGGYIPTLRQMMDIVEGPGLSVLDVENIRLHYARTLEHWLDRYEANLDQVRQMYDEFFVRAWRLYLAASIANFRAGSLQLYQMVFARPTKNDIAWTRKHLYE